MNALYLFYSLLATLAMVDVEGCSTCWSSVTSISGQKVYHLSTTNQMNWWEAHNMCRLNGFELATIDSKAQYDVVVEFLKSKASELMTSPCFVVGAWDAGATAHNFTWTSNGRILRYKALWGQGEPNNGWSTGEDVTQLIYATDPTNNKILAMNDIYSAYRQCYVFCESSANVIRDLDAPNVYYHVERSLSLNWFDANRFCRNHNMRLASIQSPTEYEKFKTAVRATGEINSELGFWTSGNDITQSVRDSFFWFSNGKALGFADWATSRPNANLQDDCVSVLFDAVKQFWIDVDCTTKYPFVCELRY